MECFVCAGMTKNAIHEGHMENCTVNFVFDSDFCSVNGVLCSDNYIQGLIISLLPTVLVKKL